MRPTRWLIALLIAAICALASAPSSLANSTTAQIEASEHAAVGYLQSQQEASGAFAGFGDEWVPTSLAAAGVAPASVRTSKSATDARSYYRALWGNSASWPAPSEVSPGTYEKAVLAAYASGIDPARVSASQNLIARVLGYYDPATPGYYGEPGFLNNTIFALLALADGRTTKGSLRVPAALLERSVTVLRNNQHKDGGFTFARVEGDTAASEEPGEAETTGAAIAALCAAGVPASDSAVKSAVAFLVAELKAEASGNGAFATEFGPNTDTNAWAVQGLDACGIASQSAQFTTSKGKTPIDFLISQQLPDGGFGYEVAEAAPNLYSSQDALRALAGAGFTAAPPKPKGAPQWEAQKKFARGTASELGLVLQTGSGASACAVSVTPSGSKVTLAQVLEAAGGASSPANCVSSFTPASGKGAITAINGQPNPPAADWKVSLDGAKAKPAKRSTPIALGDTVDLTLG